MLVERSQTGSVASVSGGHCNGTWCMKSLARATPFLFCHSCEACRNKLVSPFGTWSSSRSDKKIMPKAVCCTKFQQDISNLWNVCLALKRQADETRNDQCWDMNGM